MDGIEYGQIRTIIQKEKLMSMALVKHLREFLTVLICKTRNNYFEKS